MIPTKEYVEKKFMEFNVRMFGGRLPLPPVVLSNAKTFLGQCVAKVETQPDGLRRYSNIELKISTRTDYPQALIDDVIIHEMIHYFIFYHNLHDTSAHGTIFKSLMRSINENYGRNITVSHSVSMDENMCSKSEKRKMRVVAVIHMKDGKTGVKVLPGAVSKIITFCIKLKMVPSVSLTALYLTDNQFFNRFPTSVALRISHVDKNVLEQQLATAQELEIKKGRIIKKNS